MHQKPPPPPKHKIQKASRICNFTIEIVPHFLLFWYIFFRLFAGLVGGLATALGLPRVMVGPGRTLFPRVMVVASRTLLPLTILDPRRTLLVRVIVGPSRILLRQIVCSSRTFFRADSEPKP